MSRENTTMLLNTHLDNEVFYKLEYLAEVTHTSVSDVIKQAIDHYYEWAKPPLPKAAEMLLHSGFVGCGEAEPTWSENYQTEFEILMTEKYDNS